MKTQHTPGPWNLQNGGKHDGHHVITSKTRDIVELDGGHNDDGEARANARLIAAAPELLRAALAALVIINNLRPDGSIAHDLHAAIATATQTIAHP